MAAKLAVAAGEEYRLNRCQHGDGLLEKNKRNSMEAPGADESPLKKCVVDRLGSSEVEHGAEEAAKREMSAGKRMTRLPQAEIDSILATVMDDDRLPPDFRALKRHNPDLIPSPEEEMDEELVSFYDVVREFYAVGVEFREFQDWVRSGYAKNGYVEVDDEFLANRAEGQAVIEEARKEALAGFDFSDLID